MKILSIIGCRPNFMKMAPIARAATGRDIDLKILHTGQHFDRNMSGDTLKMFGLRPDINLGVCCGSHAGQASKMMVGIDRYIKREEPDIILVVGDTNSTLAGALVGSKENIPVAHVEAGMRSFDKSMPEEVNRIVVDHLSTYLFCCAKEDREILVKESVGPASCHIVGNTMFDCFLMFKREIVKQEIPDHGYGLFTLHRASNVDNPGTLIEILDSVMAIAKDIPIYFPVHPRTKNMMEKCGYEIPGDSGLIPVEPMGYFRFMAHVSGATFVITDSGGLQAETSFLNTPCYTLRDSTEHRWTLITGTNRLVSDHRHLQREIKTVLPGCAGFIPGADGRASERILDILCQ